MTRVRLRVDFASGASIGPGKIALLEAIAEGGSLSEAARRLGMSYRRAWLLLDSLNRAFDAPLTLATVGGRGGGGVRLAPLAEQLIARYRGFEAEAQAVAQRAFRDLESTARRPAPASPPRPVKRAGAASRRSGPKPP